MVDEQYYTVYQIAEMLGVTAWTVREWLKNPEHPLVGIKPGHEWRVSEFDLKRFLEVRHG